MNHPSRRGAGARTDGDRRRFVALAASLSATVATPALLLGCGGPARRDPVVAYGAPVVTLMDFGQPLPTAPVPPGWRHRTFFRTPPMQIGFVARDGRAAIRLATDHGASMLIRETLVPLDSYPSLAWGWFVETPVTSAVDETTEAGDDHPARLYLSFRSAAGESHAMEIIWGNRTLHAGDWKVLESWWRGARFPHYVARGGDENVGRWHDERVDLRALYRVQWGDPAGVSLEEVALFCDTDATGGRSVAYFSSVQVARSAAT